MKKIQIVLAVACLIMVTMQSCSKKEQGCNDTLACNFDSSADENDGTCVYATKWYQDSDGDGLGEALVSVTACEQPVGYVSNPNDFDGSGGGNGGGGAGDLVVVERQRAIVTYVGATWCPPCGNNGDPAKIYMEDTYGDDVIILNVQSGDDISQSGAFGPTFGQVFQTFVASTSIPHAYWSGNGVTMDHRGFYASAAQNNSAADANITAILSDSPEVGVAAKATLDGSTVSIKTLSKFYSASTAHHIGVYLLEDGVMAQQSGPGTVTSHENVMRAGAFTGNDLGVESLGASFTADQEVVKDFTIAVPGTVVDDTKLQIAVVVWSSDQADGISNAVIVDVN